MPADTVQYLQQQHQQLHNMLFEVQDRAAEASQSVWRSAQDLATYWKTVYRLGILGEGVPAWAYTISAQIPLSSACNNITCVSLEKSSELALVRGKGCLCSGCKAARWVQQLRQQGS
jgi:hypothetical protein